MQQRAQQHPNTVQGLPFIQVTHQQRFQEKQKKYIDKARYFCYTKYMIQFPNFLLMHNAATTFDPVTGNWHAVVTQPTQQDWTIAQDEWKCIRFNALPPTQGELT